MNKEDKLETLSSITKVEVLKNENIQLKNKTTNQEETFKIYKESDLAFLRFTKGDLANYENKPLLKKNKHRQLILNFNM